MRVLNSGNRRSPSFVLLGFILALAAHTVCAQIRIGGVTIPTRKRAEKQKTDETTSTSNTPRDSDTKSATAETPTATPTPAAPEEDFRIGFFHDEIKKAKSEVDGYSPAEKLYLVSAASAEWLLRAVSPKERQAWFKTWGTVNGANRLIAPLDELSASAAQKMPTYKPNPNDFKVRNPTEERMMIGALKNASTIKIHKIGLEGAVWLIDKNDFGIPTDRFKRGYIWARDTSDDHPYCHVYTIIIQQDYSGGGTYGASWAKFYENELFGCP
jgi:hypothetical protein